VHDNRDILYEESRAWKKLAINPLYRISKDGYIYNDRLRRLQTLLRHKSGYIRVGIHKKSYAVHRLVAMTYVPNPLHKTYVNHKDGNVSNNNVSNLEWCTQSENCTHAHQTGLNKCGKAVIQKTVGGKELARFKNMREAAKSTGVKNYSGISKVCKGRAKTAGGYKWEFV
jgi:hypothetical protein